MAEEYSPLPLPRVSSRLPPSEVANIVSKVCLQLVITMLVLGRPRACHKKSRRVSCRHNDLRL